MSCGIPQESVLGPPLWNIGCDYVLRGDLPDGVSVICYETLVLVRGESYQAAAETATPPGVATVVDRIQQLGLKTALHKAEAICFHGPWTTPPPGSQRSVGGVHIGVGSTMKYLVLILDSRWTFEEHFRRLAPKLDRTEAALKRLLPNLGGPDAPCRRLYAGIVRSMALYGTPVWAPSLGKRPAARLNACQRIMAIWMVRGYTARSPAKRRASLLTCHHGIWRQQSLHACTICAWRCNAGAKLRCRDKSRYGGRVPA
ncbi:hypothetical protein PYW07_003413 [Mythimna separata]|uniref:Reverse transcriptase n=1 Tax=Mythimna separata TaxID=271217 RepID=A0AAD8DR76_MYTSE|nr:hypothetical protein PYW07_003413 [Mythimna separata]